MIGFDNEKETALNNDRDTGDNMEFKPIYSPSIGASMSPVIAQQNLLASTTPIPPPFIGPYPSYWMQNPYWYNWHNYNNWNHCKNCNTWGNYHNSYHRQFDFRSDATNLSCNLDNISCTNIDTLFRTPIICRKCSELFD